MKFFMHRINPISILKCFIHFLRFKMGMIAWVSDYIQGFKRQSHIIIHVTSQSKFKKKKIKKRIRLNGHTCPTYPFVPHHTPHTHKYLFSHQPATYPPSFVLFLFLTNTHSSFHCLTLPWYPLHTTKSTIIFLARITGKLSRNL